jgi:predicted phosphodiesterase
VWQYKKFNPQNTGIIGARRLGVYDSKGHRVGQIPLGSLTPPNPAQKIYSFGALSDVHIVYETATDDFQAALTYLNKDEDVAFVCICGDLTDNGTATQLAQYKAVVDDYSADTTVYAIAGNHEAYASQPTLLEQYTGKPLYYSFTHGDDVFIMVGICSGTEGQLFASGELQWLYETLEANRNKRCFLFQHIPPVDGCGDILNLYPYTKLTGSVESLCFKSLLRHYTNTVFFHGHTHMKYYLQKYGDMANYDKVFGCHSVHIPSLSVPRDGANGDGTYEDVFADSEGYVVDVYENGIHLRGRDFVKGEFLPIASYWLDTTLQTIPAGTYTDSTGTITK